ncbi:hypothetical protein H8356DRAFT_1747239 [Neocallimastix lanati (nom. inval.)]|nr:hypothetical protein H8356DRAFT_1747239 [Neocallimastix sp. JGI-2020a]
MESNYHKKCIFFFFLSPKLSALITSIIMLGICVGSYFLNIMIYEEIGQFLLHVALIFGVCVIISLVVFIIGLIINHKIMIKQISTIFAVYIFFSLSCFCCNFITIIFGDCYRESYNLYTVYLYYYLEDHPDTELEDDEIKSMLKKTFYIKIVLHILTLGIMIYYYIVTSAFAEELCEGIDIQGQKFGSIIKDSSKNNESGTSKRKSNI